jgi:hypothetical protein
MITVGMPWERWQTVLALLGEVPAPARITVPLLTEIQQQCQRQLKADGAQATNVEPLHVPH